MDEKSKEWNILLLFCSLGAKGRRIEEAEIYVQEITRKDFVQRRAEKKKKIFSSLT
jgi:hypothetical protein